MSYIKYSFDGGSPIHPSAPETACNGHSKTANVYSQNGSNYGDLKDATSIQQSNILGDYFARGNRLRKKFGLHWPLAGLLIVGDMAGKERLLENN